MKDKIMKKVEQNSTDEIKKFLSKKGISPWKLSLASRDQLIEGIKEEINKYSSEKLERFYNDYFA